MKLLPGICLFWLIVFLPFGLKAEAKSAAADKADSDQVSASPKAPWGEFDVVEEEKLDRPWPLQALLWIPNRLLDFIDIFRVDLGAGPAVGAVARITKYGQFGYRNMMPASLRIGDFGRTVPLMVERSNEFGIGPAFVDSKDRKVCTGELGLGLDLFLIGGYAGVCVEEVADFIGGIFLFDPKEDDLR